MAPLSRRGAAAALVALPFCWTGARAQATPPRRPTPAQTEGPFYPVRIPADADADLLRNSQLTYARGQPALVEGVVSDLFEHYRKMPEDMPTEWAAGTDAHARVRGIADFVGGMTDRYALIEHARLVAATPELH